MTVFSQALRQLGLATLKQLRIKSVVLETLDHYSSDSPVQGLNPFLGRVDFLRMIIKQKLDVLFVQLVLPSVRLS